MKTRSVARLGVLAIALSVLLGASLIAMSGATSLTTLSGQDQVSIEPLGHFGGWLASIAVPPSPGGETGLNSGDYIYLGEGSGLTVLDVSDPTRPRQVGSLVLDGFDVTGVAFAGTTAYVVNGKGLQVVDLSDPARPVQLASLDTTKPAASVAVTGVLAYVGLGFHDDGGLAIVNVSDPTEPALVGSYDSAHGVRGIRIEDGYAYLANSAAGLVILDLSNPIVPTFVSAYPTLSSATDVEVLSNRAYVTDRWSGLHILNVADPAHPSLLGSYAPGPGQMTTDVAVVGTIAYLAGGSGGLRILDVSNPANPILRAISNAGWPAGLVAVANDRAYVGSSELGVRILNVSSPDAPVVRGAYLRPMAINDTFIDAPSASEASCAGSLTGYGTPTPCQVLAGGPIAYMVDVDKLWIVDESDPAIPVVLSSHSLENRSWEPSRVTVATHPLTGAHLAYVMQAARGVETVDVSDPQNPVRVSQYPLGPGIQANDIFVRGHIAYVPALHGTDGQLYILDTSNPTSPTELTVYETPGEAHRVFVAPHPGTGSDIAYVADGGAGLRVLDVGNPAHPVELSHIAPPSASASTHVVSVVGQRVYVGSDDTINWWVHVFDVADPAHPTPVDSFQDVGQLRDFAVADDLVYVAFTSPGTEGSAAARLAARSGSASTTSSLIGVLSFRNQPALLASHPVAGTSSVTLHSLTNPKAVLQANHGYRGRSTYKFEREEPPATPTSTPTPAPCGVVVSQVFQSPKPANITQLDDSRSCTVYPAGLVPCTCAEEMVPVAAVDWPPCCGACGWNFFQWSGTCGGATGSNPSVNVSCPDHGTCEVLAEWRRPVLGISGESVGGDLCASSEHEEQVVLDFTLCANDVAPWTVTGLQFQASGSGKDDDDIEQVTLRIDGQELVAKYAADDGIVPFSLTVEIAAGQCKAGSLAYQFNELSCPLCDDAGTQQGCEKDKEFSVTLTEELVTATPAGFPNYLKVGTAVAQPLTLWCVKNETTGSYFHGIQQAVDDATDGHFISVCPGTYIENVELTKSLTVRSLEKHGARVIAASSNDHVFHIKRNDTTLDGFTVRGATGSDKAGIYAGASVVRNVQILSNLLTGNWHGIYLKDTEGTVIRGNQASSNSEMGLLVDGATQTTIESNFFSDNTRDGVHLRNIKIKKDEPTQTRLADNFVTENNVHGIHVVDSSGVLIERSVSISKNAEAGIMISGSDGVEVVNNLRVEHNRKWGISIVDSQIAADRPPIVIAGNVLDGIGGDQPVGIYLKNSRYVHVGTTGGNTLTNHREAGISVERTFDQDQEAAKSVVQGNEIRSHGVGVLLESACGNLIGGSNLIGPGNDTGVLLDNCQCPATLPNDIRGNTKISGNHGDGVGIRESWGNVVAGNLEIADNVGHGISVSASRGPYEAPNRILSNAEITRNGGNGVDAELSSSLEVADNVIAGNAQVGVHLHWTAGVTVQRNEIVGTRGGTQRQSEGIIVLHSEGFHGLKGNTISDNSEAGIYVRSSHSSTAISGNTITGGTTEPRQRFGVLAQFVCGLQMHADPSPNTISGHREAGIYIAYTECSGGDENRNAVAGNTVRDNPIGIWAVGVGSLWIGGADEGNTISESSIAGIQLERAESTTVEANTVGPANRDGIRLEGCTPLVDAPNRLLKNGVGQNTRHGIVLVNSYGNIIGGAVGSENTIVRNGEDGLRLESIDPPRDRPNTVSHNTVGPGNQHGIVLQGVKYHELKRLTVQGNTGNGISLMLSPFNKISDSPSINDNGGNGISVRQSDKVEVFDVQVRGNAGNGVRIEASELVKIYGAEVRDNTGSGILLDRSIYATIGLEDRVVKAVANQQHGVCVIHGHSVKITGGEYDNNAGDGIRFEWGAHNEIGGTPKIRNNQGDGIGLSHSRQNTLKAAPPSLFIGSRPRDSRRTFETLILSNGGTGIALRNGSNSNHIENFKIQRHGNGIFIDSSHDNTIQGNEIVTAGICIRERSGTGNNYGNNAFVLCGVPVSPAAQRIMSGWDSEVLGTFYLEDANPTITGNVFEEDAGDAVRCVDGAAPVLHKNSFLDIAGYGLLNTSPSVTVDARENWWGDPSGPGGDGPGTGVPISGTALFEPWRPITVSVVVDATPGVVYAPRGIPSAHTVAVVDWDWLADDLTITVSDERGWLDAPGTSTVSGVEIVGVGIPISFTVPAGVALGATDSVTITATSAYGASDTDIFRIVAAGGADLALTGAVQPSQPLIDTPLRYTLIATNHGPDMATSVVLSNTLEAGLTFISAEVSQGTCVHDAGAVVCALGTLAPAASANTSIVAQADLGMTLSRAVVTSALADPDPTNNLTSLYTLARSPAGHVYLPLVMR